MQNHANPPVHNRVRVLRKPASPTVDENRPIMPCTFSNGNTDVAQSGLYAKRTRRGFRIKRKACFMGGWPEADAQAVHGYDKLGPDEPPVKQQRLLLPNGDGSFRRVKQKPNILTQETIDDHVAKGV